MSDIDVAMDQWIITCRLRDALRAATGPRFDRAWDGVITDIVPEVMKIAREARRPGKMAAVPVEPLTGGDADINVRVRIKRDCPDPGFVGRFGTLVEYGSTGAAVIRFDNGSWFSMPRCYVERAPTECPHCGASQVTR